MALKNSETSVHRLFVALQLSLILFSLSLSLPFKLLIIVNRKKENIDIDLVHYVEQLISEPRLEPSNC